MTQTTPQNSVSALLSGLMPERYLRNQGTIGLEGQLRLLQAKVLVAGAGGLGGYVIEFLARQGVGELTVVDGDAFACQNLNRQLLASEQTLGMNKALVAASRLAEINSDVTVNAIQRRLDATNASELLAGMDVIVDALDNYSSRRILLRFAKELKIPVVHAAIAGFTGQVTTILPEDSVARELFDRNQSLDQGIEVSLGNPATTPAFAAALQAQEVVKLITGVGRPLSRQLFYFDLEYNLFELIQL